MENILKSLVLAGASTIGVLFGGYDNLLRVLLVILMLDILTGVIKSFKEGNFKSRSFRLGLLGKVVGYLVIVISIEQFDQLCHTNGYFRNIMILFVILNELISILENISIFPAVKIPKFLVNSIEGIKDQIDNGKIGNVDLSKVTGKELEDILDNEIDSNKK